MRVNAWIVSLGEVGDAGTPETHKTKRSALASAAQHMASHGGEAWRDIDEITDDIKLNIFKARDGFIVRVGPYVESPFDDIGGF